jgi:hypothetical protein
VGVARFDFSTLQFSIAIFCWESGSHCPTFIWRFPEMGVSLNHPI